MCKLCIIISSNGRLHTCVFWELVSSRYMSLNRMCVGWSGELTLQSGTHNFLRDIDIRMNFASFEIIYFVDYFKPAYSLLLRAN